MTSLMSHHVLGLYKYYKKIQVWFSPSQIQVGSTTDDCMAWGVQVSPSSSSGPQSNFSNTNSKGHKTTGRDRTQESLT